MQEPAAVSPNADFETLFGPAIGHGSQATVYDAGDNAVKVYNPGYPKWLAYLEAFQMAALEVTEIPTPHIHEVRLVNNQLCLVMDKARGKPLVDMWERPAPDPQVIEKLARIQADLNATDAPASAGQFIQIRVLPGVSGNTNLSDELKAKLLEKAQSLPTGIKLCHGDFNPGNVLFDGDDYLIVDLLGITAGVPAADAAASYVSNRLSSKEWAEAYLGKYLEITGIPRADVDQWIPFIAAELIGKVPDHFTKDLWEMVGEPSA
jgi:aminoglycoside phosphotransferase